MTKEEQAALLRRDVDAWNEWRQDNPEARADLAGADLSGADLVMADLSGACLAGANLTTAKLSGADLRRADLTSASLAGARLVGVDFQGATLAGADLRTAEDLTEEQLEEARGDEQTILPDGIERPNHWHGAVKVNLAAAFAAVPDQWRPRIVGDVNDTQVKVVKLLGEFIWHHHEAEDELFLVHKGRLLMRFRDREMWVEEGEFVIVPRGVEHQPVAEQECEVVLVEPRSTLNTGNVTNERTVQEPERLE